MPVYPGRKNFVIGCCTTPLVPCTVPQSLSFWHFLRVEKSSTFQEEVPVLTLQTGIKRGEVNSLSGTGVRYDRPDLDSFTQLFAWGLLWSSEAAAFYLQKGNTLCWIQSLSISFGVDNFYLSTIIQWSTSPHTVSLSLVVSQIIWMWRYFKGKQVPCPPPPI